MSNSRLKFWYFYAKVTTTMDNSRTCHRLMFHERGKQNCYELIFSRLWVSIMHGLTWSELNYYAWFRAACPCLSWSAVAVRALISAVFVLWASFTPTLCSGSSPSRVRQWTLHIYRMHETTFRLHEMRSFKIYGIWPQTDIHTTSAMQSR